MSECVPERSGPRPPPLSLHCPFCLVADGYIGPTNGTVTSPECRGLDPQVNPRDASEPVDQ